MPISLFLRTFPTFLFLTIFPTSTVMAEILVHTVAQLVTAVNNTKNGGDRTILVADGNYSLNDNYLRIGADEYTNTVPVKPPPAPTNNPILSWLFLLTGGTP